MVGTMQEQAEKDDDDDDATQAPPVVRQQKRRNVIESDDSGAEDSDGAFDTMRDGQHTPTLRASDARISAAALPSPPVTYSSSKRLAGAASSSSRRHRERVVFRAQLQQEGQELRLSSTSNSCSMLGRSFVTLAEGLNLVTADHEGGPRLLSQGRYGIDAELAHCRVFVRHRGRQSRQSDVPPPVLLCDLTHPCGYVLTI
eukprot:COSAG05_NODE_7984_length_749_cov_0.958462_1_plen_200_part_00